MTTVSVALASGADSIVPAASIEEAAAIADRLGRERVRLCGERRGLRIDGFDLGNSPLEYTPGAVGGKIVVLTTSNGTATLLACTRAEAVYCGALVNADAIAGALIERGAAHVVLVCSGTDGAFALEDAAAAGAIIEAMMLRGGRTTFDLDDATRAVEILFRTNAERLAALIAESDHGRRLRALGCADDVTFCSQLDLPNAPAPLFDGMAILPSPIAAGESSSSQRTGEARLSDPNDTTNRS